MVMGDMIMEVDVVVIGAGPGGCAAAFRAADLGFDVAMIDSRPSPGGNYLHQTCIPQHTYLEIAQHLEKAKRYLPKGLKGSIPTPDFKIIHQRKSEIIEQLTNSLINKCKEAGVLYIKGKAFFKNSTTIRLKDSEVTGFSFKHAVIATGSSPAPFNSIELAGIGRVVSPSEPLTIESIPNNLLIVGAGSTGIELANIYSSLGCMVDIVDEKSRLFPHLDDDLITIITNTVNDNCNALTLGTHVINIVEQEDKVLVEMQTKEGDITKSYDRVILATGQIPSSDNLGLDNTKVQCNDLGFISTDNQQRTSDPNIFAAGDVTTDRMYSHIASRQGQVAAEVISGLPSAFDVRAIPYTINLNPSLSWCGLTEKEAKSNNIPINVQIYQWKQEMYSMVRGELDGLTKVISQADNGRILGVAIIGHGSAELISEGALAVEMGALVEDLSLTLHGHPTRSELLEKAARTTVRQ